jgi:hypothetical protein
MIRAAAGFLIGIVVTCPPVSCGVLGLHPALIFPVTLIVLLVFTVFGAYLDDRAATKRWEKSIRRWRP